MCRPSTVDDRDRSHWGLLATSLAPGSLGNTVLKRRKHRVGKTSQWAKVLVNNLIIGVWSVLHDGIKIQTPQSCPLTHAYKPWQGHTHNINNYWKTLRIHTKRQNDKAGHSHIQ